MEWRAGFSSSIILLLLLFFMAGCAGTPANFNAVQLTPSSSQTIGGGGSVHISASVLNDQSSAGVTWTLSPATGSGSLSAITSAGATFNAPASVTTATTVTVTATSVNHSGQSATLSITVQPAPKITTTSLPSGGTGGAYSATVSLTGGVPNFAWSVASGSLPPGLALGASTTSSVTISGTPTTVGLFTFTIKATDSTGTSTTSQSLTIRISNLAIATTSPLANGSSGSSYSLQFQATGGTVLYQWSVASGSTLPAGLTLSAGGLLSGTPTTQATTTFGITLTDSATPPASVTQTFSLTIGGPTGLALLKGQFAFEFSGFNSGGAVVAAGSFTADGSGNITNGVQDFNSIQGPPKNQTFTGTYTLGSDNRGTLIFSSLAGSPTYAFAIDSTGAHGRLIEFDSSGIRGSGELEKQSVTTCGTNTISTTSPTGQAYVFGVTGAAAAFSGVSTAGPVVAAGAFTALPPASAGVAGSISGEADVNIPGITIPTSINTSGAPTLSGTFQTTSQTARCIMSLAPQQTTSNLNFSVYPVSGSATALTEAFVVELDSVKATSPYLTVGRLIQQCILVGGACATSPFAGQTGGSFFTAPSIGALTGQALNTTVTPNVYLPDVAIASLTGSGGPSFTMSVTENQAGAVLTYNGPFQANFVNLDLEGRVSTDLALPFAPVFYVINQNKALCIGQINNNPFFGIFEPQSVGPFSASTIKGAFVEGTSAPATGSVQDFSGVVALDGVSAVAGAQDTSSSGANTGGQIVTGTYSNIVAVSGSGNYALTSPTTFTGKLLIVSPTQFVLVSTTLGDANPVLVIFGN